MSPMLFTWLSRVIVTSKENNRALTWQTRKSYWEDELPIHPGEGQGQPIIIKAQELDQHMGKEKKAIIKL